MIYNVKTIKYKDSVQVRVYEKPVILNSKIQDGKPLSTESKRLYSLEEPVEKPRERTTEQIKHCLESSVNRTVNQIYSIARSNKWEYFITLTVNPQLLDNTDYILILDKLSVWVNNLKKRYAPDLKYIIVPELHKDKKKWHFHGLISNVGLIPFTFSGKTCVGKYVYDYARKPYATKVYNLPLWKYGFSTATQVRDSGKSASYITKYITKDLTRVLKDQHRYVASHNVERPIERVYNIDYASLNGILQKKLQYVNYVSNVKVADAGQSISYLEFNR